MNVKEIVKKYLEDNGFEGLYSENWECGCGVEDLVPCEFVGIERCSPGWKVKCTCGEGCDYHISDEAPK